MGNLFAENPQGTNGIIASAVIQVVAIVAVIARIWSKKSKKQQFRLNDYSIFAALFMSLACVGLFIASVFAGLGKHLIVQVPLTDLERFMKLEIAFAMVWIFTCTLIKISILDGYLQVFRGTWFVRATWALVALHIVLCISVFLELFLICRPFAKFWNPMIDGYCGNFSQAYLAMHSVIFATDIMTGVLPLFVLWKLQMAASKKIAISLIFGVGTLICVISMLRIISVVRVSGEDITYDWAMLFTLTVMEPLLGIILACLPFIQPVVNKVFESRIVRSSKRLLLGSTKSGTYNTGGSSGFDRSGARRHNNTSAQQSIQKGGFGYDSLDDDKTSTDTERFALTKGSGNTVRIAALKPNQHTERGSSAARSITKTTTASVIEYQSRAGGNRDF